MNSASFPYPLVVCDAGGTNFRIAFALEPGGPLIGMPRTETAHHVDFDEALLSAILKAGVEPASLIVCAAGPIAGHRVSLTNSPWRIDGAALVKRLRLRQGLLLNDFEALALTLPTLTSASVFRIGALPMSFGSQKQEPMLALGPGTGLGVAALIAEGDKLRAFPTEAGHIGLAIGKGADVELMANLRSQCVRLTAESILSGTGLVRLHRARMAAANERTMDQFALQSDGPAFITDAAIRNPRGVEAETVRQFLKLTAAFAGDMALTFIAKGGVVLCGGILPRLIQFVDQDEFRAAFEDKPPLHEVVATIPTAILTDPAAVLAGMRSIADRPEQYSIDFERRNWSRY